MQPSWGWGERGKQREEQLTLLPEVPDPQDRESTAAPVLSWGLPEGIASQPLLPGQKCPTCLSFPTDLASSRYAGSSCPQRETPHALALLPSPQPRTAHPGTTTRQHRAVPPLGPLALQIAGECTWAVIPSFKATGQEVRSEQRLPSSAQPGAA